MLEIEQKDKEKNILFPLEKSALIRDIAIGKIILLWTALWLTFWKESAEQIVPLPPNNSAEIRRL